jgi:hypothetical protein
VSWDLAMPVEEPEETKHGLCAISCAFYVEVEFKSGLIISWSDYQNRYWELNSVDPNSRGDADQPNRYIHIDAYMSPVRFFEESHSEHHMLGMETSNGMLLPFRTLNPASLAAVTDSAKHPCDGFLIMYTGQHNLVLLVVRNVGRHWERVALLSDRYQELK